MFDHILDLLCMRMLMFGDCRHSLRAVLKFSDLHYAIRYSQSNINGQPIDLYPNSVCLNLPSRYITERFIPESGYYSPALRMINESEKKNTTVPVVTTLLLFLYLGKNIDSTQIWRCFLRPRVHLFRYSPCINGSVS